MTDYRFQAPGIDLRFPAPGIDWEHGAAPLDLRFPSPGTDVRFAGGYGAGGGEVAPDNITLTGTLSVLETAPVGTVIGTVSANGYPAATITISSDPDGKFTLVGTQLRLAATVAYATKTSHSVTVRAENDEGFHEETYVIAVTDVLFPPVNTVPPVIGVVLVNLDFRKPSNSHHIVTLGL